MCSGQALVISALPGLNAAVQYSDQPVAFELSDFNLNLGQTFTDNRDAQASQ